eukprot:3128050-Rhodomonas_salina.2
MATFDNQTRNALPLQFAPPPTDKALLAPCCFPHLPSCIFAPADCRDGSVLFWPDGHGACRSRERQRRHARFEAFRCVKSTASSSDTQ